MSVRRKRLPVREEMQSEIAGIGDEPLAGSGFEDEAPETDFSETPARAPEPERLPVQ
jgi:hypothetical protein